MAGTLVAALEVRQVKLEGGALHAEAEGVNEVRDGLPVLAEIRIRYRLRIPVGTRAAVERALADRKSTRLNSSHIQKSRMPSSA